MAAHIFIGVARYLFFGADTRPAPTKTYFISQISWIVHDIHGGKYFVGADLCVRPGRHYGGLYFYWGCPVFVFWGRHKACPYKKIFYNLSIWFWASSGLPYNFITNPIYIEMLFAILTM